MSTMKDVKQVARDIYRAQKGRAYPWGEHEATELFAALSSPILLEWEREVRHNEAKRIYDAIRRTCRQLGTTWSGYAARRVILARMKKWGEGRQ